MNLEQIRAQNAFAERDGGFRGAHNGEVVKKIPAMIITGGFLGALAFASETKIQRQGRNNQIRLVRRGHANVFAAIISHINRMREMGFEIIPPIQIDGQSDETLAQSLQQFAAGIRSADALRAITAETMAFLSYLRRFAKPGGEEQNDDNDNH